MGDLLMCCNSSESLVCSFDMQNVPNHAQASLLTKKHVWAQSALFLYSSLYVCVGMFIACGDILSKSFGYVWNLWDVQSLYIL